MNTAADPRYLQVARALRQEILREATFEDILAKLDMAMLDRKDDAQGGLPHLEMFEARHQPQPQTDGIDERRTTAAPRCSDQRSDVSAMRAKASLVRR